ncbi:helix-turn-helix transcriptional regulator [Dysosmobacter welbionis]
MELNERLRELRKEQGETQKQVAAAIGIGARPSDHLLFGALRPILS